MWLDQQGWGRLSPPGGGYLGDPGVRTEGGGRWHGGAGLERAWLGSSSLFLFSAFCLFGFALVYLCVRFLLTEASVNDIAVLNSMLGTLLCPCFGLFPFESEGFLSGQLLGSRGFHCGGRET